MKKLVWILVLMNVLAGDAETNSFADVFLNVSNALQILKEQVGERALEAIKYEAMSFEQGLRRDQIYKTFAADITNDWQMIITNVNQISTNYLDKFLIFSTGKLGDENLYLAYYATLSRMRLNNEITERDLNGFYAVTRYDLSSAMIRRYREPVVSNLVETLKVAQPVLINRWNRILSGEAYQNYLEEVECGQWGPNPPR